MTNLFLKTACRTKLREANKTICYWPPSNAFVKSRTMEPSGNIKGEEDNNPCMTAREAKMGVKAVRKSLEKVHEDKVCNVELIRSSSIASVMS